MAGPIGWRAFAAFAALGCGALAAGLLPPKTLSSPQKVTPVRPEAERRALAREIGEVHGLLEREMIEQVLDESPLQIHVLTSDASGTREPAARRLQSPAVDDLDAQVRALLDEAGEGYGIRAPVGRMALVYAPGDLLGRSAGPPASGRGGSGTRVVRARDGAPLCLTKTRASGPGPLLERAAAHGDWTLLTSADSCLLDYWFGAPGPAVGDWYAGVGRAFARTLPGTRPWGAWPRLERGAFGKRTGWGLMDDVILDRCRGGELEVCEEGWTGVPQRVASHRDDGSNLEYRGNTVSNPFRGWGDGLLFQLLEEMGPERFQTFWTSDLPVGAAFRQAFGTEPGAWIQERLVAAVGPATRGPAPGGTEAAAVLTLVLGCGVWGGFRGRRRRVGEGA